MAKARTVWGIDIGQMALKALKLRSVEGQFFVDAFDLIEHPKMLCQDDVDADQLVQNALAQFLARNNVSGSTVCVAMPGRSSFTRFVKLPPVEKSKIPDIVQFEAGQQIPFPINDVVWRYQTFEDPDSPDVEVGLFAVKRVDVFESLAIFTTAGVPVDVVQMAPLALYNFMLHDEQVAPEGATILADVGADKTDLVVADGPRIWMRTIQIGGRNFTQALEKAFKLSFAKAEKLKRAAAANKYARQVFQAMRPVFADLVQEIQRSIGYYTQKHRDTKFTRLLGLGNGFRLPGLQKFLERNLNTPVVRIDGYNRLSPTHNVNMPVFTDNVLSFAVAYGLAIQGLGEAEISTNLLPREVARKRCWDKKRLWFAGAAAAVLLAAAMPMYRATADGRVFESNTEGLRKAREIVKKIQGDRKRYRELERDTKTVEDQAREYVWIYGYRSFWPDVQGLVSAAVAYATRDHVHLLTDPTGLETLKKIPRKTRKLIFIESMTSRYFPDLSQAKLEGAEDDVRIGPRIPGVGPRAGAGPRPGAGPRAGAGAATMGRGFQIVLTVRTPMDEKDAASKLMTPLIDHIRKNGRKVRYFKKVIETDARGRAIESFKEIDEQEATGPNKPEELYKADFFTVASAKWTTSVASDKAKPGRGGRPLRPAAALRPPTPDLARAGDKSEDEGPKVPSPLFPDEDISTDTKFTITLLVEITGDGIRRKQS